MRRLVVICVVLILSMAFARDERRVPLEYMLKFSLGHELYNEVIASNPKTVIENEEETLYILDSEEEAILNHKMWEHPVSACWVRNSTKSVYAVSHAGTKRTKADLIRFANFLIKTLDRFLDCNGIKIVDHDEEDCRWTIKFTKPDQHLISISIDRNKELDHPMGVGFVLSLTDYTLLGREPGKSSEKDAEAIFYGNENALVPVSPIRKTGEIFADAKHSLVIITAGDSTGSGFVARDKGSLYLYTNAHLAKSGLPFVAKRLDGTQLELSDIELAENMDLIRFKVDSSMPYLEFESYPPNNGDKVSVLGNSGGGLVVTTLTGEVLGVGPELLEISAKFVLGNSGSPVLNEQGHVIGVATCIVKNEYEKKYAWAFSSTRFTETRRFAVRPFCVKWKPVNRLGSIAGGHR